MIDINMIKMLFDIEIIKIFSLLLIGALIGCFYRFSLKLLFPKVQKVVIKNIGKNDRIFRFLLAFLGILCYLYFKFNFLLVFSGFCLYEASFSWCGLYALIGKNSCKL